MPDFAVFATASCIAALMLIVSIRALTWHKVSVFLTSVLLLLVLFATWQVLTHSGPVSVEMWGLFFLCGLSGLVAGLVRGQNTPMRFVPGEGDVLCRRGALLPFFWAATVVTSITLLTMPGRHAPAWAVALPPALVFLTVAFTTTTLTIFARISTLRREHFSRLEQERLAQQ